MKVIIFLAALLLAVGPTLASSSTTESGVEKAGMPEKYLRMENKFWGDPQAIAAGKKIYRERCAICHGESGDGRGVSAQGLPVKPANFADKKMAATMRDGWWFWRVSKGGAFPPFNSPMPSFESILTEGETWQVISYAHSFSHNGAHAHKELNRAEQHLHHD